VGSTTISPINDAWVGCQNLSGDTFLNLRNGTGNVSNQYIPPFTVTDLFFFSTGFALFPPWTAITRGISVYDTSFLSSLHLLSAQYQIVIVYWDDVIDIRPQFVLEECSPADPLNIVASDYNTFSGIALAAPTVFDSPSYAASPYTLASINQTGYTIVGSREYRYDFGDTTPTPTGHGESAASCSVIFIYLTYEPDTLAATLIGEDNATLNGQLTSVGTVTFQYGLTNAYGNETVPQVGVSGAVSQLISGLAGFTTYHFRIKAIIGGITYYGSDMTFTTIATVDTIAATNITDNSAQLNGMLNAGGNAFSCGFQWGLTNAYGETTVDASETGSYSNTISPLSPNTTYHFRAFAIIGLNTIYGADMIFTTLALPSITVDTYSATNIQTGTAQLNGQLTDDGGAACNCGFQWGPTIAYGNTTPTTSQVTGDNFNQVISSLTPGITYHFRAFATNSTGTSYGADAFFTTLILLPTVDTVPATDITTFSAELVGLLANDGGEDCNCGFQWGPTIAYGNTTPTTSQTTGFTFDQIITGLTPGISYHFRALAMNSAGTAYGSDLTFSTLPLGLKMSYPIKRRLT